jgi:hypothetical protein
MNELIKKLDQYIGIEDKLLMNTIDWIYTILHIELVELYKNLHVELIELY